MNLQFSPAPLSDEDLARLDELCESVNPEGAMVLEELDGFLTALSCAPQRIAPMDMMHEMLGLDEDQAPEWKTPEAAAEFEALVTRHFESIDAALRAGEGFAPILAHDDDGLSGGNLWAIGFLRAIALHPDGWESVEEDEELAHLFEPFESLAEEMDPSTGEIVQTLSREDRQQAIDDMIEAAFALHEHFEASRSRAPGRRPGGGRGGRVRH